MKKIAEINFCDIKAALICAASKDIRFFLNGVRIRRKNNILELNGTDGHILFCITVNSYGDDFEIIIPRLVAERALALHKALHKKLSNVIPLFLSQIDETSYVLGDLIFKPIDGKFPNVEKFIPKTCSGEFAKFMPKLIQKATDSLYAINGAFINMWNHNGLGGAVVVGINPRAFCVVVPIKDDTEFTPHEYPFYQKEEGSLA